MLLLNALLIPPRAMRLRRPGPRGLGTISSAFCRASGESTRRISSKRCRTRVEAMPYQIGSSTFSSTMSRAVRLCSSYSGHRLPMKFGERTTTPNPDRDYKVSLAASISSAIGSVIVGLLEASSQGATTVFGGGAGCGQKGGELVAPWRCWLGV